MFRIGSRGFLGDGLETKEKPHAPTTDSAPGDPHGDRRQPRTNRSGVADRVKSFGRLKKDVLDDIVDVLWLSKDPKGHARHIGRVLSKEGV